MILSFRLTAIALAAAILGLTAPASAQTYAPSRIMKGAKMDDLRAIVASYEHEIVQEDIFDTPSLAARDENGTIYLLSGTACDDQALGCQGVNMQVRFDLAEVDYALVNQLNMDEQAVNVWFDSDSSTLGVTRYVVLDHGITMENLRENVSVLLGIAAIVAENF